MKSSTYSIDSIREQAAGNLKFLGTPMEVLVKTIRLYGNFDSLNEEQKALAYDHHETGITGVKSIAVSYDTNEHPAYTVAYAINRVSPGVEAQGKNSKALTELRTMQQGNWVYEWEWLTQESKKEPGYFPHSSILVPKSVQENMKLVEMAYNFWQKYIGKLGIVFLIQEGYAKGTPLEEEFGPVVDIEIDDEMGYWYLIHQKDGGPRTKSFRDGDKFNPIDVDYGTASEYHRKAEIEKRDIAMSLGRQILEGLDMEKEALGKLLKSSDSELREIMKDGW